jgi:hypothetical protein
MPHVEHTAKVYATADGWRVRLFCNGWPIADHRFPTEGAAREWARQTLAPKAAAA